jgi:hypothetical protein
MTKDSTTETYTSMTGVHAAMGDQATEGKCEGCGRRDAPVYPWPLMGAAGMHCAACVVMKSGGQDA